MSKRANDDRHTHVEQGLSSLPGVSDWRYERSAQRYLVTLAHDVVVQGGERPTNVLVMTLGSAESFLAGASAERMGMRTPTGVTVDPEGVAVVQ